jgi:hypothetical protein
MASIDDFLMEFGSRTGLGRLVRNGDGVCRLVFDGALAVDVELRDGDACFSGVVGPGETLGPGTMRIMLAANLLGDETGGAALGIDESDETVVLSRRLIMEGLTYLAFENALGSFVDAMQVWRSRLGELDDEAEAVADAEPSATEEEHLTIFRM